MWNIICEKSVIALFLILTIRSVAPYSHTVFSDYVDGWLYLLICIGANDDGDNNYMPSLLNDCLLLAQPQGKAIIVA